MLSQIKSVHVGDALRPELRQLALELFEKHGGGDSVGKGRRIIAVGRGKYRYGSTTHESRDCPRILEIGEQIARSAMPAGQSADFTHGLIAATPA